MAAKLTSLRKKCTTPLQQCHAYVWVALRIGRAACRVTTCLENLEMSGNFKDAREKSWKMGKVRELSEKTECQGKLSL